MVRPSPAEAQYAESELVNTHTEIDSVAAAALRASRDFVGTVPLPEDFTGKGSSSFFLQANMAVAMARTAIISLKYFFNCYRLVGVCSFLYLVFYFAKAYSAYASSGFYRNLICARS